jgi:glycosyltransferase involved in cell wall biosynthesis
VTTVTILSSVHLALDNRVFYREARSLQQAGYTVNLIAVHDREEVKEGIHIMPLPSVRRWQRPVLWLLLFDMARKTQADLYHFHDPELLLLSLLLHWLTGKPTIYDVHEVYADFVQVKEYIPAWLRRPLARMVGWLEPRLARWQSGLIFADDQIAATFASVDRPKTTLFNFPSRQLVEKAAETRSRGAEEERSKGEEKQVGEGPFTIHNSQFIFHNCQSGPVVLYLGGMERNRGTELMMAAFERVLDRRPDARLLLVGHFMPGELEQEVREDARARGIADKVTITGRVSFEQIGHYLQQACVGWVSWQPFAKNEKNIPTKLFEYMAYGLPVVTSDLASVRPFIRQGVNGLRVKADDPVAHGEAILMLLENPERAWALGREGQKMVATRFNWDLMELRLLGLYEGLLGRREEIRD